MYQKLSIFQPTIFLTLCLLLVLNTGSAFAEESPASTKTAYIIQEIKSNLQGDALGIEIIGNTPPVYTMYDLFNPARLILDIANASLDKAINTAQIIPDNSFAKVTTKPLTEQDPSITRFEITINESHTYSMYRDKNNLLILIHPKTDTSQTGKGTASTETVAPVPAPQVEPPPILLHDVVIKETKQNLPQAIARTATPSADSTFGDLIDSSTTAMSKVRAKGKTAPQHRTTDLEDSFNFGGYQGTKRISVDFFKIDLHNVFRLFREISGINIIVDEAVQGSLTLALNDVPWDFALDIILNLKDLRKEERFNTIVIYPAKKEFVWPERAQDNLSVESDLAIIQQQDSLVIEQSAAQSAEMIQSKELIARARVEQKNENIEKAIALYEQAFKLDPKNAQLSNRLATLYLVNLGINARAVYFAKETLKIEPRNTQAALYAAIGLANMNQIPEATDYFAQSISDPTPRKEALISYASFSEQNGQPENALKLIARYNAIYGESVETMVTKARIYDQMGETEKANEQYRVLLASGYTLMPGLKQYIQSRLSTTAAPGI
ncbi:MAG: AMIN domain-containing protein [Desulfoarculaceae bacterium]|nr:AMIN domain-containing protein [Desulfoarculaceae bacterium]